MPETPIDEPIDTIKGDAIATAWRRAARRHQAEWRAGHAWPAGTVTIPRSREQREAGVPQKTRPIGSRIDFEYAKATSCNFLTPEAAAAVAFRLSPSGKQAHQTLDERRLYCDLLSSMPMCFNIFGPLWSNSELCTAAVEQLFNDLVIPRQKAAVTFEWSPGRRDAAYLGDRTAFDAAIHVGPRNGGHLIGIETKYHEYPITERRANGEQPPARYVEVSERAGLFRAGSGLRHVWGTPLEQIWRDHLLALACQQHADESTKVRYVLIAPRANAKWAELIENYRAVLTEAATETVAYLALEDLLDSGVLPHAEDLRARYIPTPV